MKILIVDDDEICRNFLERILLEQGYQVEGVPNGKQALDLAAQEPPELIISDILMPELDGFELCRRVKTDDRLRNIPFVFYSAIFVAEEDERLALKLGASRFLVKPMELDCFVKMIRDVIREHQQMLLPVPDRPLADRRELERLQMDALKRRLEQKVAELARERQTRKKREEDYRELENTLQQLIGQAVEEERKKDDQAIIDGRQAVMGEMINNLAHQWRQPINMLGLLAQDLYLSYKHGALTKGIIEGNLKKTMELVKGMSRTIEDFRTFFKPDRQKVDFKVVPVISKVQSLVQGSFEAKQIGIKVEASGDPVVTGYPGEFSQVILNILLNARDAFPELQAQQQRVVSVQVEVQDDRTVITISDNAGGIPGEIIGKVFDPYFTTKGPDRGTGVGLFMSKSIIEKNMGGSLTVRNVGDGAEFRIVL